ncbi:TetR/AcrR family transcriptional regulator [Alcanivorax sp.]|jgi:AcrR family transcriptional regulator|uniref:TetR/AcrR family transcriptional regulator n=1 Tax=Alcanivorax sp. TaxID=1872427 RepID=UPI0032D9A9C7
MTQQLSERGQRRRQALLDAATHTFLQHGYERTTLDMIIAEAGGSRRSLYEYFGDKRGLFSAVITHHAQKMVHDISNLDVEDLPAREGLELLGHAFFKALTDPVNLELYRLLIAEGSAFADLGQTVYEAGPHLLLEQLQLYLQCLHDRGQLPGAQPDPHAARQFFGMIKADFQLCALLAPTQLPNAAAITEHIRSCVTLLLENR